MAQGGVVDRPYLGRHDRCRSGNPVRVRCVRSSRARRWPRYAAVCDRDKGQSSRGVVALTPVDGQNAEILGSSHLGGPISLNFEMSASLIGRSGSSAFQAIHHFSVDVACGLVLLFGLGAKALPVWDSRTRRNNLLVGLTVR